MLHLEKVNSFETCANLLIDFYRYGHFAAAVYTISPHLWQKKKKKNCENLVAFKKPEIVMKDRHLSPKGNRFHWTLRAACLLWMKFLLFSLNLIN